MNKAPPGPFMRKFRVCDEDAYRLRHGDWQASQGAFARGSWADDWSSHIGGARDHLNNAHPPLKSSRCYASLALRKRLCGYALFLKTNDHVRSHLVRYSARLSNPKRRAWAKSAAARCTGLRPCPIYNKQHICPYSVVYLAVQQGSWHFVQLQQGPYCNLRE